jgi:coenzyme F420-0:L-glutamate ligase/coenzyme F420-1:gamma-L-glutamate ligase
VDASNVREGFLALLPEDPDASAERVQKELTARLGLSRLGVVITDTFGRPWREGVVDVAIGCAGLPPLVDLRGRADDHGRALESTVVALADAVAAASGLVMTKTARVPAALVRGLDTATGGAPAGPAVAMVRAPADDLFRESTIVAVSAAQPSRSFSPGAVDRGAVEEAVGAACAAGSPGEWLFVALDSPAARRAFLGAAGATGNAALDGAPVLIVPALRATSRSGDAGLLAAGAAIRNLVVALHARGLGWSWDASTPFDGEGAKEALSLGEAWRPLAVVGAGRIAEDGGPAPRPPPDVREVLDWRG